MSVWRICCAAAALAICFQVSDIEFTRRLWRIWVEQARQSTETMSEQARRERASFDERLFWQRGIKFQKRLNQYAVQRIEGVEDLHQAERVQKAWLNWQKCRPWPRNESTE